MPDSFHAVYIYKIVGNLVVFHRRGRQKPLLRFLGVEYCKTPWRIDDEIFSMATLITPLAIYQTHAMDATIFS
jgi:hypothetical protein